MLKLSLAILMTVGAALSAAQQSSVCPMVPSPLMIQLPPSGLTWLSGETSSGPCDGVPPDQWIRATSKSLDLWVYPDGPQGSGRYWTVTVGLGRKEDTSPVRGACFMTRTVGWRTLQHFKDAPLLWSDDLDVDGVPELVIWSSFPLVREPTESDHGLVAWVYQADPVMRQFTVDWKLSRNMAGQLAAAYREPLERNDVILQPLRNKAADALESFAKGTCRVRGEPAR